MTTGIVSDVREYDGQIELEGHIDWRSRFSPFELELVDPVTPDKGRADDSTAAERPVAPPFTGSVAPAAPDTGLLRDYSESLFDRLTRLATGLCGQPPPGLFSHQLVDGIERGLRALTTANDDLLEKVRGLEARNAELTHGTADMVLQRDEARAVIDRAVFELGEHSQAISLPAAIRALRTQLTQAQSDLAAAHERNMELESARVANRNAIRLRGARIEKLEAERDEMALKLEEAPKAAIKVEPGSPLEVGATYRITAIDRHSTESGERYRVGDVLPCGRGANLLQPGPSQGAHRPICWYAWLDIDEGSAFVTGLELVSPATEPVENNGS